MQRPAVWRDRWPPVVYWMKVTAGVIVVIAAARAVQSIGNILVLILVALVLAIGFQPAIAWLQRRGFSRGWAVTTIFLSGFVLVGGFLALIVPSIVEQVGQLVRDLPSYIERAQEGNGFLAELNTRFDLVGKLQDLSAELPSQALAIITSFTSFLFNSLTVLVLTLFFMSNLPLIERRVAAMLRRDQRQEFEEILHESTQRVGGYVLGALTVSAIAGATSFVALLLIGVPFPAAIAFVTALTDLIPTIGALIALAVAVTVAAFAGPFELIATLVFYVVYQQIENYVIQPKVMKRAINISAATVIVAVLIGGSLLGIIGALLAIPLTAVLIVVVRELYLEDRLEEIGEAPSGPAAPA